MNLVRDEELLIIGDCEMVDGWRTVEVKDENGVVVDIDRGEEMWCQKPAVAMSNDGVGLCRKHADLLAAENDPDIYVIEVA